MKGGGGERRIEGTRAGYRDPKEVERYLNRPEVLASIGASGKRITHFTTFKVTSGGTQSQLVRFTLNDGRMFFVKQTPHHRDLVRQEKADINIRDALGSYVVDAPFILMLKGENFGPKNAIAIFPNVQGYMLSDGLVRRLDKSTFPPRWVEPKISLEQQPHAFRKIGVALSRIHIDSMRNKRQLEEFYQNGCNLNGKDILVHEDFQASNVMFSEDDKVFFVDTDGIKINKENAYHNIEDAWKLIVGHDPIMMKAFLEGYISNYAFDKQQEVLDTLRKVLKDQYKLTLPDKALPKPPIAEGYVLQSQHKKQKQEEMEKEVLRREREEELAPPILPSPLPINFKSHEEELSKSPPSPERILPPSPISSSSFESSDSPLSPLSSPDSLSSPPSPDSLSSPPSPVSLSSPPSPVSLSSPPSPVSLSSPPSPASLSSPPSPANLSSPPSSVERPFLPAHRAQSKMERPTPEEIDYGAVWQRIKTEVEELHPRDIVSKNVVAQIKSFIHDSDKRRLEELREKISAASPNIKDDKARKVFEGVLNAIPSKLSPRKKN